MCRAKYISSLLFVLFISMDCFSQTDITPPAITSINFSPQTIDVTNGAADVTITVNVTDNISGAKMVVPNIQLPGGNAMGQSATLISGTTLNGVWQAVITIPQYSQPGNATMYAVSLYDSANNNANPFYADLVNQNLNADFQIVSNTIDNSAPSITSINFSPQTIDVTNGAADVTITVNVTDNISGAKMVVPNIQLPGGNAMGQSATLISGTTLNGVWQAVITIPQYSQPGNATMYAVSLYDSANNNATPFYADLVNQNLNADFQIISNTIDNSAPSITSINFSPQTVDITNGAADVTITVNVTDNISGAKMVVPNIQLPGGSGMGQSATLISGTTLNGVWQAVITIPQYSQPGTATMYAVSLYDSTNNNAIPFYADLVNQNLNTTFQIVSGTVPVNWESLVTATIHDHRSIISWSVSSQINNAKFIIEHSIDGIHFKVAGELIGSESTQAEMKYEYVDPAPNQGNNYYRIKQIDNNGEYRYSNVAYVRYEIQQLQLWPNPVPDIVNITVPYSMEVYIADLNGSIIKKHYLTKGANKFSLGYLSKGVYFLTTRNNITYTFIKL
ncbi:T9SS type A sorting domain-containing protein [Ferruginibacter lapsinanis]|uniref:T9SS type A sorting domain-containing protein n=1 Tax=Ferruginibacter lapsinanis TaxID=563172 RepID=UPI001E36FC49|nr:T9SS type A sorting domain-containing protein [Ferruginibacter lapsinanis]UEG49641.1 T9SS type A sorting domain-containing protein [Ferruginibacter lapsinanis]